MTGTVIPFPLAARRDFIQRHANIIRALPPDAGERHLMQQLKIKRNALKRRSVSEHRIEREIASLHQVLLSLAQEESVA